MFIFTQYMWQTVRLYPCAVVKPALALSSELSSIAAAQRTTTLPEARPENWPASWAPRWADQRERSSERRWSLELVVLLVTEGRLLSCCRFPLCREFGLHFCMFFFHCFVRHDIKMLYVHLLLVVNRGPKYHLLAHTTLSLSHVQDSFRTHDLTISGNGEWQPPSICALAGSLLPPPDRSSVCSLSCCHSSASHALVIFCKPPRVSSTCFSTLISDMWRSTRPP